ncbi:MAG: phage holin family protein [Flavitalea sp.]
MEELKTKAEDLTKNLKEYAETYYKLTILKVTDKATNVVSGLLAGFSVLFFGVFVLLFSALALASWLGQIVNSEAAGYLIVAGIFLLIIIILVMMRKRIVFPMIRNKIIRKLYE